MDKTNVKRWAGNGGADLHDRGNVWFIPYETVRSAKDHPSAFPVKLPEMCIKDAGLEYINLVVDPFMGIGTTGQACINLGVDYIGFEIDPKYCGNCSWADYDLIVEKPTSKEVGFLLLDGNFIFVIYKLFCFHSHKTE